MPCRLLVLGALALLTAASADEPRDTVRAVERHMRQVIDVAEPSVVAIAVSHKKYPPGPGGDSDIPGRLGGYTPPPEVGMRRPFPRPPVDRSLDLSDPENIPDHQYGSGLVLDPADGLILTNYHLIEGATKIYVWSASGRGSYADIRAADARSDLAVLRLIDPLAGIQAAKFGDVRTHRGPKGEPPTVARGMWVIALGHPLAAGFAEGSPSASWGILSNVRQRAGGGSREEHHNRALHFYSTLLQTDARVTLGCSGGAILNMDGEVIGLTSPLAAVTGADTAGGYAIPFDRNCRRIVDVLRQGKEVEYGFLGVAVEIDRARRVEPGLPIKSVSPGTPAADAGLRAGDVIVAVDDKPVREPDDLFLYVGSTLAGTEIFVTVESRGQRPRRVPVRLAKFHHTMPYLASEKPPAVFGLRVEWRSVLLLRDGLPMPDGVVVREVVPNSPADAKLRPLGDVVGRWMITRVDDEPVRTPAEFQKAVRKPTVRLTLLDIQSVAADRERTITLP